MVLLATQSDIPSGKSLNGCSKYHRNVQANWLIASKEESTSQHDKGSTMPQSWANTELPSKTTTLEHDLIYVISDLHLGDGTRSDSFGQKRDVLRDLLKEVQQHNGHLVIAGDLIDFHQGWSIDRVITAHAVLFRELSEFAKNVGVTYIWSHLDYDLSYFEELFLFQTCSSIHIPATDIAPSIRIEHGFQYDPTITADLHCHPKLYKLHHSIERFMDTWLRFPLENFPTWENRLAFWGIHKLAKIAQRFKDRPFGKTLQKWVDYACANQMGDGAQMWSNIQQALPNIEEDVLMTGHSHIPGNVQMLNHTYINTGSWTFDAACVTIINRRTGEITTKDWITQTMFQDEGYVELCHPRYQGISFLQWWRENYLGWLQFRQTQPNLGEKQ